MTSARKNSEISINTEVYGALELIKNKILSNFQRPDGRRADQRGGKKWLL
ncbi:hypothetical protein QM027_05300 [Campylobacter concisus]